MNGAIESLKEDITSAKNEEKALKARLATLGTVMSMEDLQKNIQSLESEREELLSRLAPLRAGTAKPISAQEKETVDRDWKMWSSRAKTRKKICLELWNMLTEELPEGKTKEELWVGEAHSV